MADVDPPTSISESNDLAPLPYKLATIVTVGVWLWGVNLYCLGRLNIVRSPPSAPRVAAFADLDTSPGCPQPDQIPRARLPQRITAPPLRLALRDGAPLHPGPVDAPLPPRHAQPAASAALRSAATPHPPPPRRRLPAPRARPAPARAAPDDRPRALPQHAAARQRRGAGAGGRGQVRGRAAGGRADVVRAAAVRAVHRGGRAGVAAEHARERAPPAGAADLRGAVRDAPAPVPDGRAVRQRGQVRDRLPRRLPLLLHEGPRHPARPRPARPLAARRPRQRRLLLLLGRRARLGPDPLLRQAPQPRIPLRPPPHAPVPDGLLLRDDRDGPGAALRLGAQAVAAPRALLRHRSRHLPARAARGRPPLPLGLLPRRDRVDPDPRRRGRGHGHGHGRSRGVARLAGRRRGADVGRSGWRQQRRQGGRAGLMWSPRS
nr:hypothetical protein CFP56_04353 [Quercus suber]